MDKTSNELILYVVEVDENVNDKASWEGQIQSIKRFTERTVTRSESMLVRKVEKVHERVIEAEARDATQEREMKQGLEKMVDSVKKQIEALAAKQDE